MIKVYLHSAIVFTLLSTSVLAENKCRIRSVEENGKKRIALTFSKTLKDGSVYENDLPEVSLSEASISPDYLKRLKRVYLFRTGRAGEIDKTIKCDVVEDQGNLCQWEISKKGTQDQHYALFNLGKSKIGETDYSMGDLQQISATLQEMGVCKIATIPKKTCELKLNTPGTDTYDLLQNYNGSDLEYKKHFISSRYRVVVDMCENWSSACPDGLKVDEKIIKKDELSGWCGNQIRQYPPKNPKFKNFLSPAQAQ